MSCADFYLKLLYVSGERSKDSNATRAEFVIHDCKLMYTERHSGYMAHAYPEIGKTVSLDAAYMEELRQLIRRHYLNKACAFEQDTGRIGRYVELELTIRDGSCEAQTKISGMRDVVAGSEPFENVLALLGFLKAKEPCF